MEIQKVSGQTFQRRHFISADAQKNLKSLLDKMNKESNYPNKDSFLDAKILSGLKVQNSHFVKELWDDTSIVAINNKTGFYINNETGEVKKFKKPLFSRWKNIIPQGEKIIETADKNFEDKTLVKRRYIKMPSLEEAQNFMKMLKELRNAVHLLVEEHPIHKLLN